MMVYCYIAIVYGKTQGDMYRRYIVHSHIFSVFALQCNCSWSSPYIVLMLCSCTYHSFSACNLYHHPVIILLTS